jgi:hypothetical protein
MAAAAGAIYFRKEIMAALSGVIAYFQPIIDSVSQLYTIFMATFGGIVAALQSGSLETAAGIAWAGFSALAWTAIANIMKAFTSLLGFLESYLPGISAMFNSMFGSIGKALLAGRWDIAASIVMTKLYNVFADGVDRIRFVMNAIGFGIATVFDQITYGAQNAFEKMVNGILSSLLFLQKKFYDFFAVLEAFDARISNRENVGSFAAKSRAVEAQQNGLKTGNSDEQRLRAEARFRELQRQEQMRLDAKRGRDGQLGNLVASANNAYAAAGSPTFQSRAADARKALDDALAKAKAEQDGKAAMGVKAAEGPKALAGAALTSKTDERKGGGASGTFSAIASALGNRVGADAAQSTAKNTGLLVKLAKQQLQKVEPGLAP